MGNKIKIIADFVIFAQEKFVLSNLIRKFAQKIKYKEMNTISIDTNIYRGAEIYAQMHNISITELAEKALLKVVGKKENFRLKKEEELSPAVRSLIGIAKPSGTQKCRNEQGK